MPDYYEENFEFLKSFHPLSRKNYDKLFSIAEFKEFKANERLVNFGDIPQNLYLINKGVTRGYFISESEKELTKTLFTPIDFFASFTALIENQPSGFAFETLTDCHIYEIDHKAFAKLCQSNFEILKFYSRFLEFLFKVGELNHIEVASLDAKQRYLKLRQRIPEIDNLIPQYQIASYLNITPVQLSRIRAKLY
ncbi:MAG: Crp/Fnr family transcriptional regulator [Flavobacteriaceae bacterium]|nr:Crp/Fnr family transcriptional regulator [Bacteroidia bacterium]NNL61821.1 Crp/Fnr family transcriptional regulator [Flavobacteriaceae bacterium]